MLKRTDIRLKLERERRKNPDFGLARLLENLQIDPALQPSDPERPAPVNTFDFDQLETGRIFHLDTIRATCIRYRLRFLDLRLFKPDLPDSARQAIDALELEHGTRLEQLKVMAPSRLFKLKDRDDPLLFAPLGNGYYYLVHQWGNHLHPLRLWMAWPFRNIVNLAAVVVLVSLLVTLLVPSGLFSKQSTAAQFWIVFFFMFKSIAAVVIFYGFALGKDFNPAIWNSKYYNS